ncbi:MAG: hypothetical protein ACI9MR_004415, partial [Myxococcota bacterium]
MNDDAVATHVREIAAAVAQETGLIEAARAWAPLRFEPWVHGDDALHLDDVSGVPFLQDIVGVQYYQLRTRVRAGDGDLYVAACPGLDAYERYCRDTLKLGAPTFVQASPVGPPIEVAKAAGQGKAFATLVDAARQRGALTVHPYMGIAPVWELGASIALEAGVPVRVLAPPPETTIYANDKACVTALAARLVNPVLGFDATVETHVAQTTDGLADGLRRLAGKHPRVALKMTRFASAMGNRVFDASALLALDPGQLHAVVQSFLDDKGWVAGQNVMAVAWHEGAPSPSTQLWIPTT